MKLWKISFSDGDGAGHAHNLTLKVLMRSQSSVPSLDSLHDTGVLVNQP